ncbi:septal ring lytic transglycosylase RlpA family protein [Adhaeribacter rhizoryzae]|uniref:Probable endolytic peptidoglycan transglycosylase RlpA n=1 Tax=Adhaeribacter rhizoryzae TaxID=2607907 RepID=A0A5M6CX55_9BACT|nr:septal ring lytic transglycosylase RlpA family protein [Adhaeribacter rhizoryzae]KAA5539817.1 septal ring lytic transglycosylase RlpA family protein [Adhaeribacter rhizoryzae]
MRITKLHYVFSFLFILFIGLSQPGFAQKKGKIQKGLATWYGIQYHGKKTSSGEVYNKNRMTAAHPTLPFGTKVKVTNSITKKSVIVRVNDRGPFGNKQRIIDLSEAAARKIKIYHHGEAQVIVEVLSVSYLMEVDKENLLAQAPAFAPENATNTNIIPAYVIQALEQPLMPKRAYELKVSPADLEQFASGVEDEELNSQLGKKGINNFVKQLFGAS